MAGNGFYSRGKGEAVVPKKVVAKAYKLLKRIKDIPLSRFTFEDFETLNQLSSIKDMVKSGVKDGSYELTCEYRHDLRYMIDLNELKSFEKGLDRLAKKVDEYEEWVDEVVSQKGPYDH